MSFALALMIWFVLVCWSDDDFARGKLWEMLEAETAYVEKLEKKKRSSTGGRGDHGWRQALNHFSFLRKISSPNTKVCTLTTLRSLPLNQTTTCKELQNDI